jgi:type II secretion system protein H
MLGLSALSPPSDAAADNEAGFTLIEILSVLVIIGLLTGLVVVTLPSTRSETEIQAQTLVRQLNALSQDGLISGEIRGFGLSKTGYALYRYDGEQFISAAAADWPNTVEPALKRNNVIIKLPEDLSPQILFEPTQISTPFVLDLSGPKARFELQSKGDGRVILVKTE